MVRLIGLFLAVLVACTSRPEGSTEGGATSDTTTLIINSKTSDPAPKKAFEALVRKFEEAHPDVKVRLNVFDHESYKTSVRNFLTSSPPDVITWNAGNRMQAFVQMNLLENISDLWTPKMKEMFGPSVDTVSVAGKQYGVPYAYYQWGIFYRKDLFKKHGIAVPTTWDAFFAAGQTLKNNGITPITIGTKYLWPAAGWFDYLNLRINGLPFHQELMAGRVSYEDPRVKAVFAQWQKLVDEGFFLPNHAAYSWQEAQAFLYQGKAAMYLMGNMLAPNIPANLGEKVGCFQFPTIDSSVAVFENAPTDTLHIPAGAKNKQAARKFLAFAMGADIQSSLSEMLLQLPPNQQARIKDDPYLKQGRQILLDAKGLAQFYDRDTRPEMAKIGMQGFQEFMLKPERGSSILSRLENARQRIFKTPK